MMLSLACTSTATSLVYQYEKIINRCTTLPPEPNQQQEPPPGLKELTAREREVLRMIADGASNKEIASALFLSEGTVRNHISHILTRLNLRDRTQAAIVANTFSSWLEPKSPSVGD